MTSPSLLAAVPALAAAALLSGCSGSSTSAQPVPPVSSTPPASPAPEVSPSTADVPTATASPSPSPVVTASPSAAAVPSCFTSQLRLSVSPGDSGAGQFHQRVTLTNGGSRCTVYGYPGASFVDAAGKTLGSPAGHSTSSFGRVLLEHSQAATAVLTYSNAGAYPDSTCAPQQADRLRIYPPANRDALLVKDPILVCSMPGSGQLHIGPLQAGTA